MNQEQYIEDFEVEKEIVMEKIIFNENLIKSIKFIRDIPDKELLNLNQHLRNNQVYADYLIISNTNLPAKDFLS